MKRVGGADLALAALLRKLLFLTDALLEPVGKGGCADLQLGEKLGHGVCLWFVAQRLPRRAVMLLRRALENEILRILLSTVLNQPPTCGACRQSRKSRAADILRRHTFEGGVADGLGVGVGVGVGLGSAPTASPTHGPCMAWR